MNRKRPTHQATEHQGIVFRGENGTASAFHIIPPLDLHTEMLLGRQLEPTLGRVLFDSGAYDKDELIDGQFLKRCSEPTTRLVFDATLHEEVIEKLAGFAIVNGDYSRSMLPYRLNE